MSSRRLVALLGGGGGVLLDVLEVLAPARVVGEWDWVRGVSVFVIIQEPASQPASQQQSPLEGKALAHAPLIVLAHLVLLGGSGARSGSHGL